MNREKTALFALVPFSLSLFLIVYQICLFAGELAAGQVFTASVLIGMAAASILAVSGVKPAFFIVIIALSLPLARLFAGGLLGVLAGEGVRGASVVLDSLFLAFDRNLFIFGFPYYFTAILVYIACRYPYFLKGAVFSADVLFVIIFIIGRSAKIPWYEKPLSLIILVCVILFLQMTALIFSAASVIHAEKKESVAAAVLALLLMFVGALAALKPAEENALGRGGGLLAPKLFSFDFAPFLHLENEITMNDSLVFIVQKKTPGDKHYLLRRFVLSAFDAKSGWTRNSGLDEEAQANRLPQRPLLLNKPPRMDGAELEANYFLVNIDPAAFIAFAEPKKVTPFINTENASFKAAYAVLSDTSDVLPYALIEAVPDAAINNGIAGISFDASVFSEIDLDYYTKWSGDLRIKTLAEEITRGISNYWEKAQTVYLYLKYGDYRYSLKPGTAVDGDQLGQFLFGNKKGYCSYFAFAYAALLRSIGIPARIAVGFFINLEEERLGFYPVRANMAHAWTEVFFPGYGWIEFDPTTAQLAEGENFSFSEGMPPDFEKILKEILETERIPLEGAGDAAATEDSAASRFRDAARFFVQSAGRFLYRIRFLIAVLVILFLVIHYIAGFAVRARLTGDPRKKAILSYRFILRLLSLKQYRTRMGGEGEVELESDFAKRISQTTSLDLYALYSIIEKARFAEYWTLDDTKTFFMRYHDILTAYKTLKWQIKLFFFPVLLMLLFGGFPNQARAEDAAAAVADTAAAAAAVADMAALGDAETLLEAASGAEEAENWEKAAQFYTQGKTQFPDDSRFPRLLGNLYYSQTLYRLAYDEYQLAEKKDGDNTRLLYSLAQTSGLLNLDAESAHYYERILEQNPDDITATGSLAWMYFKLHRLQDGAALLENAIDDLGETPDFMMTLAIIYSDMYRYDQSREQYLWSIDVAERFNLRPHASLAHYNFSILESKFYRYQSAFTETEQSLFWQDRSSGYLARGELYLRQLRFEEAARDYETALESDPSALSKISLALTRQLQGKLDEAYILAKEALDSKDLSWMLNYGINVDQYKRDIYEILYKTSSGLYQKSRRTVYAGFLENLKNIAAGTKYYFSAAVYKLFFEKYSLSFAKGFGADLNGGIKPEYLELLGQYMNAFEKYPRRALVYLSAAAELETELIPESRYSWLRAEGEVRRDTRRIEEAAAQFDKRWEADEAAEAYQQLYHLYRKGEPQKARAAAAKLFLLNRGALLQNGIPLPVALEFRAPAFNEKTTRRLMRRTAGMLKKSGFELRADSPFVLSLYIDEANAAAEIYDRETGKTLVRKTFAAGPHDRRGTAWLVRAIAEMAFIADRPGDL